MSKDGSSPCDSHAAAGGPSWEWFWLPRSRFLQVVLFLVVTGALVAGGLFIFRKKSREEAIAPRPLRAAENCSHQIADSLARTPVSIAQLDDDRYLLCNYSVVQEVNLRTGVVRAVLPAPEVSLWNPTGLCVTGQDGIILIANYTGHDVLEMRLRDDRLELVHRYVHAEMVSPENVALSADGKWLGVADYDSNRLLVFQRGGALAWSRPVGNAHGVTFGPDGVVVSGLYDRTITLFDLEGKQLKQTGGFGWGAGKYQWPTCVTCADDRYYVSDAHTGRITVLDRSLNVVDWFGGNGPGAGLFNMPYGLCVVGDELLICDTFKHRLVRTDRSGHCRGVLSRTPEPLCWDELLYPVERRHGGYFDPQRSTETTLPSLGTKTWTPGYWGFELSQARKKQGARYPEPASLFNGRTFPYLCWCVQVRRGEHDYLLLGHSEDTALLIVEERGRCLATDAKEYLWCVKGRLYTNAGSVFDPLTLVDSTAARFAEHDRLLKEDVDPVTAAQRVFWPNLSVDELRRRLEGEFVSPAGKTFWSNWSRATNTEEWAAAGRAFDAAVRGAEQIHLQEVFARQMLAPQ